MRTTSLLFALFTLASTHACQADGSALACDRSFSANDSKLIYEALSTEERNVTPEGLLGSVTFEKSVGSLICHKRVPVVPNPVSEYECSLK